MNRYGLVQFYASDYENTFPKMNLMRRSTHTFRMKMNHMPFQNSNNGLPYCFNRNESHAIDTILWTACWKLTDDPFTPIHCFIVEMNHLRMPYLENNGIGCPLYSLTSSI